MLSSCLSLDAISLQSYFMLSLSCYKLVCHYFPMLAEYFMYLHLSFPPVFAAMLCCSEDDEFFDEYFF
jgi:hypothetical protein